MVCPNCGYNNQPNNRFCVRCGIDVSVPPPPETPSFETGPPPSAPTGAPATPPAGAAPPPPPPSPNPGGHAPPNPWGAPHPNAYAPPGAYPPPGPNASPGPYGAPGSAPAPPPYPGPPGTGEPANPFAPPNAYAPPGAYPPPGPGPYASYPPPYAPSVYQPAPTNGLAIAALVLGLVGWIPCGIGSIAAVVLGFVARGQIREAQGRQGGDGLALTGIILGFIAIGFWILIVVFGAINGSNTGSS